MRVDSNGAKDGQPRPVYDPLAPDEASPADNKK